MEREVDEIVWQKNLLMWSNHLHKPPQQLMVVQVSSRKYYFHLCYNVNLFPPMIRIMCIRVCMEHMLKCAYTDMPLPYWTRIAENVLEKWIQCIKSHSSCEETLSLTNGLLSSHSQISLFCTGYSRSRKVSNHHDCLLQRCHGVRINVWCHKRKLIPCSTGLVGIKIFNFTSLKLTENKETNKITFCRTWF